MAPRLVYRRSALQSWCQLLLAVLLTGILVPAISTRAAEDLQRGGSLSARWKPDRTATTSLPVMFSFHREESGAGRISIQLGPEGPRYVGQYLRLTGNRPHSRIRIYYTYWVSDAFDDYRYGPAGAELNRTAITIEQFQRRYSGSVVAKLIGSGGGGMRCVFALETPDSGLADAATGHCQLTDGGVIDLVQAR